jgi:hypothetical protein
MEQTDPHLLLEFGNGTRDRWLRHMQLPGGEGESARAGDGEEVAQML